MATSPNIHQIQSSDQFQQLLSADLDRLSLLYFWAPWAEPCKQMTEVVVELSKKYPKLLSLQIEAEAQPDISESFEVESVPHFVLLRVRRLFASLSRTLPLKHLFYQHRVTLYSNASQAQMLVPSLKLSPII
jgi:thioredoxin-like negative regulator of GroEL